jgi:hypothetical protein
VQQSALDCLCPNCKTIVRLTGCPFTKLKAKKYEPSLILLAMSAATVLFTSRQDKHWLMAWGTPARSVTLITQITSFKDLFHISPLQHFCPVLKCTHLPYQSSRTHKQYVNISIVLQIFSLVSWGGVNSPLSTLTTIWPIIPAPDDDECGAVGGMSDKGNQSTPRKSAPFPPCTPQIPLDLTWAASVERQQLTA